MAGGAATPAHRLVEPIHGHWRPAGIGAHLGQGGQGSRAVESGVLHALRRHRAGVLLPSLDQLEVAGLDGSPTGVGGADGSPSGVGGLVGAQQRENQVHGPLPVRIQIGPGPDGGLL